MPGCSHVLWRRRSASSARHAANEELLKLRGNKGYDNPRVRRYLRRRGMTARIARLGRDSSSRLGRIRWVVERTLGWLPPYERLPLRHNRSASTINALARLAVTHIGARRLPANKCKVC